MISPLLMVSKHLSEFEKSQIVAYNDCGLPLCNIANKLNHHHSSHDVHLKDNKKTGNYYHKKGHGHKGKTTLPDTNGNPTKYLLLLNCLQLSFILIKSIMSTLRFFVQYYIYIYIYTHTILIYIDTTK